MKNLFIFYILYRTDFPLATNIVRMVLAIFCTTKNIVKHSAVFFESIIKNRVYLMKKKRRFLLPF